MSIERKNRVQQFKRVVMSFADFKEAVDLSDYMISHGLYNNFKENKLLISAMNCSMIMAYSRPFSGNQSRDGIKIPDLGKKALRELNPNELTLHKSVMSDRNKLLAHSDSDAVYLKFIINKLGEHTFLQPIRNRNITPLDEKSLILFKKLAVKLLDYVASERNHLENEIIPLLEKSDLCDKEEASIYGINPV
jgi:hypothetical protein